MAPDLSGPLSLHPHQPVDALRVPWLGFFGPLGHPKVIFVTCRLICPMGPGAGGSRVVKSESGRLLQQRWNEPGDYRWVVEGGGNRIALDGATDAASPQWRQDKIHFRPMHLDGSVLGTDPLLSADGV